ncbi:MAG TPA: sugar phosphate isomerase/epimerase, partial [Actinotalea sp.]|nr:sugar phosphate isomerase/epimerase [Actinotalea sp.]
DLARRAGRARKELGDVAARAADRGLTVGYHNHWWETALRVDGSPALEVLADLLEDRVLLEVDVYWAAVGGEDPAGLLRRLGERVVALHLKDGPLTHDVTAQQPAGHGELDVPDVLAAAPDARLVLEFDEYVGDMVEGLAASRRTVLGLEGVA